MNLKYKMLLITTLLSITTFTFSKPKEKFLLDLSKIKEGEEGYGLTIGKGTKPERFKVKILGIMHDFLPGMDIIIAKASGLNLEKSGIVAGMSGSPIFIKGKLIGALAYGWLYSKEPIMGITPIKYMLRELKERKRINLIQKNKTSFQFPYDFKRKKWNITVFKQEKNKNLIPLSPVWIASGFSDKVIEKMKKELGITNIIRGGKSTLTPKELKESLQTGGSIAIKYIGGDIDFAGVGTITYREGNTILAFGHPAESFGDAKFIMSSAKVITIMPSYRNSFKLATTGQDVGSVIYDGIAGIYGKIGEPPTTVPITVKIKDKSFYKELNFYSVLHKNIAFPLIVYATYNFPYRYIHLLEDREIKHKLTIFFTNGEKFSIEDFSNNLDLQTLIRIYYPVYFILQNPIGWYPIKKIDYRITVGKKYPTAYIKRVYFSKRKVKGGDTIYIFIEIKPYNRDIKVIKIPVKIPENYHDVYMRFKILPGNRVIYNKPIPTNFKELLDFYKYHTTSKDIVVQYLKPRLDLFYNGVAFNNIPSTIATLLKQKFFYGFKQPNIFYTLRNDTLQEGVFYIKKKTKYIIKGERYLFLKVE